MLMLILILTTECTIKFFMLRCPAGPYTDSVFLTQVKFVHHKLVRRGDLGQDNEPWYRCALHLVGPMLHAATIIKMKIIFVTTVVNQTCWTFHNNLKLGSYLCQIQLSRVIHNYPHSGKFRPNAENTWGACIFNILHPPCSCLLFVYRFINHQLLHSHSSLSNMFRLQSFSHQQGTHFLRQQAAHDKSMNGRFFTSVMVITIIC
jgi:hypothetical protein